MYEPFEGFLQSNIRARLCTEFYILSVDISTHQILIAKCLRALFFGNVFGIHVFLNLSLNVISTHNVKCFVSTCLKCRRQPLLRSYFQQVFGVPNCVLILCCSVDGGDSRVSDDIAKYHSSCNCSLRKPFERDS